MFPFCPKSFRPLPLLPVQWILSSEWKHAFLRTSPHVRTKTRGRLRWRILIKLRRGGANVPGREQMGTSANEKRAWFTMVLSLSCATSGGSISDTAAGARIITRWRARRCLSTNGTDGNPSTGLFDLWQQVGRFNCERTIWHEYKVIFTVKSPMR